jgi:hypothetical protein
MGNHEYCTECGLSNFHYGEPCPPKAKAAHQAREAEILERTIRAERAAKALVEKLQAKGIPAKLDSWSQHKYRIVISGLDLLDTKHEPAY